jgi:ABC-type glycerol-3-phosphate transport system permease component
MSQNARADALHRRGHADHLGLERLQSFASSSTHGVGWNLVFAHVVLTSLPLILVCVVLQRRVLAGLTEGGVTG